MNNTKDISDSNLTIGLIFILAIACGGIVANLFWTSVALLLIKEYHYLQTQVALFAFAGAIGVLVGSNCWASC